MTQRPVGDQYLDHDLPVQRMALLSAMFAVSAALCVLAGAITPAAVTMRGVFWVSAVVGGLTAAGLWVGRNRPQLLGVTQAALLLYSAMTAVVATFATTATGIITLGPAVIMAAVYAGCFFTRSTLWLQIAFAIGTYSAAAVLAAPAVTVVGLLTTAIAAVAIGIVLSRLTSLLRNRVLRDSLTGAISRATWLSIASGTVGRRPDRPLSIAMLDLDSFKHTNDTLGHLAGDELLRDLHTAWSRALGANGLIGRFGGDEFVVLLPDCDLTTATEQLDLLRQAHPAPWTVGIACRRPGDDLDALLDRADRDLHRAKAGTDR